MIVQVDLKGKELKKFKSVADASNYTGINGGDIKRVMRGHRNSAGGYIWKFENEQSNIKKFNAEDLTPRIDSSVFNEFIKWKESQDKGVAYTKSKKKLPAPYLNGNKDNVLFIGDLHAPFVLEGYLEFNRNLQEKYDCGTIIFAGDIVDGNSWSYHEHDVDGMSVREEVDKAIDQLKEWYEVFPNAIVLYGNHDLLVARKARTSGLSQRFIRELGDILQAPKTWEFKHEHIKDNVKYVHGSVGNAMKRATDERMSICQGHLHSQCFVDWAVSEKDAIFGLQVGCGIDREKYAFEYAKPFPKKPVISSGVILEKGTLPIVELMKL